MVRLQPQRLRFKSSISHEAHGLLSNIQPSSLLCVIVRVQRKYLELLQEKEGYSNSNHTLVFISYNTGLQFYIVQKINKCSLTNIRYRLYEVERKIIYMQNTVIILHYDEFHQDGGISKQNVYFCCAVYVNYSTFLLKNNPSICCEFDQMLVPSYVF